MKTMLDTSAYSALKRGHPAIASLMRRSEAVMFSAIVAGELVYGFRSGTRFEENMAQLEGLLDNPFVSFVSVSLMTAVRFGSIAEALRRKGTPIPTNDIWIAAQAMETGADLISFDRHFEHIDGLGWVCPPR